MIKFRELHKEESVVSKHLDVEVTLDNLEVLRTAKKLLVGDTSDIKRGILKDSYNHKAKMQMPQRKLDQLG
eukprot:6537730-Ditylum_brightwellii.AAC.1